MSIPKKVPFITECCGDGCGKTLKVAWLDGATLSESAREQFLKYHKVVSHGMCEDCQTRYYGRKFNE